MIGLSPPNSSTGGKRQSFFATPLSSPPATASASASISTSTSNSHTEPVPAKQPPSNVPDPLIRSASPPAPNFSVPSFSKKFVPKQGSIPSHPSGASGLRRGESISDLTISSVSSPPQSPTYSVASSRHTDSSEPILLPRDNAGRALRTYNSEDLLSRMARAQPAPNFSRVPRASIPSETSPPPSRPLSLVGRTGLGIQMKGEPQGPAIIPVVPAMDPSLKPDLQPLAPAPSQPPPALTARNRVPTMHVDTQLAQSMSRRRSMPGLAVGPPAAPPPNCPLPKLPPAANVAKSPQVPRSPPVPMSPPVPISPPTPSTTKQSPVNRFYQSQKAPDQATDKRKSGMPQEPTPKTAARQSRIL